MPPYPDSTQPRPMARGSLRWMTKPKPSLELGNPPGNSKSNCTGKPRIDPSPKRLWTDGGAGFFGEDRALERADIRRREQHFVVHHAFGAAVGAWLEHGRAVVGEPA